MSSKFLIIFILFLLSLFGCSVPLRESPNSNLLDSSSRPVTSPSPIETLKQDIKKFDCSLTDITQLPQVRGFRIGMSLDDAMKLAPELAEAFKDPKTKRNYENVGKLWVNTKPGRLPVMSDHYSDDLGTADFSYVALSFNNHKLYKYGLRFKDFNQWELEKNRFKSELKLLGVEDWIVSKYSQNQENMYCKEFIIELDEEVISITQLATEEEQKEP